MSVHLPDAWLWNDAAHPSDFDLERWRPMLAHHYSNADLFFPVERSSRSACHSVIRDNVTLDAALLVKLNSCVRNTTARHASAHL